MPAARDCQVVFEFMINGAWRSRAKWGALRAALKALPGGIGACGAGLPEVFEFMINGAWRSRAKWGPFAPR